MLFRSRWDKLEGEGAGKRKIFQVVQEENDISFIQNYLTADLIAELNLFTFGYAEDYPKDHVGDKFIEIKEKIREEVVETLVKTMYNGGVPKIVITGVGQEGALLLQHESEEFGTLDFRFAEKTLEYIWDLWAAPVELRAKGDDGEEQRLCFDEAGFYARSADDFGDDEDEENDDAEEPVKKQFKHLFIP